MNNNMVYCHINKINGKREQYYINLYNTIDDKYGYNITSGGDDNFIRQPLTEEQKQLVSETTKKAMNETKRRAHMLEVYKSDNWIKKNSNSAKVQWATTDLKTKVQEANGRKVQCIETGQQYMSMLEASKDTGISNYKIRRSCNETNYIADGTHWQFI